MTFIPASSRHCRAAAFLSLLLTAAPSGATPDSSDPAYPAVPVSTSAITGPGTYVDYFAASPPAALFPGPIRGVHLTAWTAGSRKARRRYIDYLHKAGLNTVVVAVKEYDGRVFIPGIPQARRIGAQTKAIRDPEALVRDFKEAGIYTIARVVVFKDDILARKRPDLAVKDVGGKIWEDRRHLAWLDPYRREVWDYNLDISARAAAAGFDEIQFDYVRFPSDGKTWLCRYSEPDHNAKTSSRAIVRFLAHARKRLKPMGVNISIAVFGLITSADHGLGIGQNIIPMSMQVEAISPMMYPSHYAKGEMGITNPNNEPYKTINRGLRDAIRRLGKDSWRLRPYLQDFSLGVRYDAEKVRAQILAAENLGVTSWILWNPANRYNWDATRHNGKSILQSYSTQ